MDIDANMIHGWPPTPLRRRPRVFCVGRLYATTLSEGVSRFILSTLFAELTDDEIEQVARAVQHAVAELE